MPDRQEPILATQRLTLRPGCEGDVPAILDFFIRNREHLEPFEPARPRGFYSAAYWRERIVQDRRDYLDDLALRLFVLPHGDGRMIIGTLSFTQFIREPLYTCVMGYSMDRDQQGRGLMTEACRAGVHHVFSVLNMHRITAGYVPTNGRSAAVLRKLGFVAEGYARNYLRIAGQWRDHVLTSLTNPDWKAMEDG